MVFTTRLCLRIVSHYTRHVKYLFTYLTYLLTYHHRVVSLLEQGLVRWSLLDFVRDGSTTRTILDNYYNSINSSTRRSACNPHNEYVEIKWAVLCTRCTVQSFANLRLWDSKKKAHKYLDPSDYCAKQTDRERRSNGRKRRRKIRQSVHNMKCNSVCVRALVTADCMIK